MTTISRDEFSQLQQRVTLLEGGNSAVQVQLTEQLRALNTQVSEVKQITTTGASSSEVQALNGKFDKLLDYLEAQGVLIPDGLIKEEDTQTGDSIIDAYFLPYRNHI